MVSQLLYGDAFKLIEKRKCWDKIRLDWDGYEGWVNHNQVFKISKESFDKITSSEMKVSNDLVNYISTQENLLFPIFLLSFVVLSSSKSNTNNDLLIDPS